MFNVKLNNYHEDSNIVVRVENSTWVNHNYGFMELYSAIAVNIVSSHLTGTCSICTLINIRGDLKISDHGVEYVESFVDVVDFSPYPTLALTETSLKAQGLQNKVNSEDITVTLINSTFIIEEALSLIQDPYFQVQNVLIQCSISKMVQLEAGSRQFIFTCSPVCEGRSKYSLEAGRLMISGNQELKQNKVIAPSCYPCPLGAKCESGIQALPNYWGYKASKSSVSMIRCPDDYCCQGKETCKGMDSCNTGRTGTMCGICEQNLTESIFTPKCIFTQSCKSGLVITLFISAAQLPYCHLALSEKDFPMY